MSELLNLSSLSADGLVLKQLFDLWNKSVDCNEGFRVFLLRLLSGIIKSVGVFGIQYFVKDPSKIGQWIKYLFVKIFYRRLEITKSSSPQFHTINKKVQDVMNPRDEKSSSMTVRYVPIYLATEPNQIVMEYFAPLHEEFVSVLTAEEEIVIAKPMNKEEQIVTICKDGNRRIFTPDTLYPSKNYIRLSEIINNFFTVVKCTKMYKAQGILIDGEPGLGKSKSCDYLASLNKYHEICYINMSLVSLLKKEFIEIIEDVVVRKSGKTIIYFDELDKYLEYNIDCSFGEQSECEDFQEYKRKKKQDFLYELLNMIETNVFVDITQISGPASDMNL